MSLRRFIDKFEEAVLSLLLVGMTLLVFAEVVARFGFNAGIHWAQELTLLTSGWFVLLGASYGIKVGSHIGVDAFVRLLPSFWHRLFSVIAIGLSLVYCALFLTGSWVFVTKMKKINIELEDIPVPAWWAQSILLIGFTLLVIRLLELGVKVIRGDVNGFHMTDEVEESLQLADELYGAHGSDTDDREVRR